MNNLKILKGGILTTIQDKGRWGFQNIGMPVAGVMDHFSYEIANFLVDNKEGSAVLECTMFGPTIEFLENMVIAITGANSEPKLNKIAIPMWKSIAVKKGDILSFEFAKSGTRTYISFGGEINVPEVNGSKSTFMKSKLGGHLGRKLLDGDEIEVNISNSAIADRTLNEKYIPKFEKEKDVRIVLGPQDNYFTKEGIDSFLNDGGYKISNKSDRMGYRMEGEKISHIKGADIISDGTVFGSIQVPNSGEPIILMADRQTTGGYTKIATVITGDISTLSQMRPGDRVRFKKVSTKEAQKLYEEYYNLLKTIKEDIVSSKMNNSLNSKKSTFKVSLNGKTYEVDVEKQKNK